MSGAYDIVMENRRELVDKIVQMMKQGYFFNAQKWDRDALCPYNPISKIQYKGGNRLRLMEQVIENGYTDPRWATLRQYREKGYFPKKGEHGIVCEKWIFTKEKTVMNDQNEPVKVIEALERPFVSYFKVFNAQQIQNFPEYRKQELPITEVTEIMNHFILTSECPIHELAQERAFYSPSKDTIYLPLREHFKDEISFAKTLLHEMGHSTGHPTRLNRPLQAPFGSPEYAKEELRAEIGSLFVGTDMGIHMEGEHYEDHSDYLKSWIEALNEDYNELFRACADAEKISQRLIGNYCKRFPMHRLNEEEIPPAKKGNTRSNSNRKKVHRR